MPCNIFSNVREVYRWEIKPLSYKYLSRVRTTYAFESEMFYCYYYYYYYSRTTIISYGRVCYTVAGKNNIQENWCCRLYTHGNRVEVMSVVVKLYRIMHLLRVCRSRVLSNGWRKLNVIIYTCVSCSLKIFDNGRSFFFYIVFVQTKPWNPTRIIIC